MVLALTGLSMLLYGRAGGEIYLDAGLITVTENSVKLAIAVTVRVLAVGLPAVVLTRNLGTLGWVMGWLSCGSCPLGS